MARYIEPASYNPSSIGSPLVNGKLFFFKSGTNTPLATFKDQFELIPNTNPVLIPANGVTPNIFFTGSAKVVKTADDLLTGETGKQLSSIDPVGGETELGNFTLWDTSVSYDLNDIVEGSDGEFYKSLSNANQANDPTTSADKWELFKLIGVWNTNITYSISDVVLSTVGNLWKALTATAGNDPETDDGTNWLPAIDELPTSIATATNLVKGKSYVSTATASHAVPAASGGAPIEITWLDGTIMTLTSASNISVTTNVKTTDTTWVFENFISTLTLVDTGTEWEIK